MKKTTKNILLGTGVVAGLGAVVTASHMVTEKLMSIAMDRKEPKIMQKGKEKLAGSPDMEEVVARMDAAEEKLLSSEYETIEIISDDGLKLVGHWKPCDNLERVLVAMHGWRSTWAKDLGVIADFWHDSNCAVLYAEQRAQGESEGEYMTFGLLERYDCLAWINWVNEKTGGELPVYLVGVSMGASTILMTAGLELPSNVRGIISDCAFTSPYAIWKHVISDNLHISYGGMRAMVADRISKRKINMDSKEYSTVDAMRVCKVPVLFIHGEVDRFVPVNMTYENYDACASEKRILIVPEAGHGMSYLVDEPGYTKAVLDFWNEFDRCAS